MLYGLASRAVVDTDRVGFARLLAFLDGDGDAGAAYEQMRARLIRFFRVRGATTPDELADATFDRVAQKLAHRDDDSLLQPAYLFGVARLIWCESLRKERTHRRGVDRLSWTAPEADEPRDVRLWQRCLGELDDDDRALLVEYYAGSGQPRIERRQALVQRLGVNAGRLRARIHRLRRELERRAAELATEGA